MYARCLRNAPHTFNRTPARLIRFILKFILEEKQVQTFQSELRSHEHEFPFQYTAVQPSLLLTSL